MLMPGPQERRRIIDGGAHLGNRGCFQKWAMVHVTVQIASMQPTAELRFRKSG
jgi:hypothetical protein